MELIAPYPPRGEVFPMAPRELSPRACRKAKGHGLLGEVRLSVGHFAESGIQTSCSHPWTLCYAGCRGTSTPPGSPIQVSLRTLRIVYDGSFVLYAPYGRNLACLYPYHEEGLHLDQNPFAKPDRCCVQGMVPLLDVTEASGKQCQSLSRYQLPSQYQPSQYMYEYCSQLVSREQKCDIQHHSTAPSYVSAAVSLALMYLCGTSSPIHTHQGV